MADSTSVEPKIKGRVAILVDGENVSQDFAGQIIMRSLALGSLVVKRVYGNVTKMPKWDAAPGFKLVHSGAGKNATDMLLAIEAMDLSYEGNVDTVVIASSDRDFTHLAHNLRERHLTVVGMGEVKTSDAFRKACTKFVELNAVEAVQKQPESGVSPPTPITLTLDDKILAVVRTEGTAEGMAVSSLSGRMHALHKVQISTYPEKTWRAYLLARPDLFDCDPKGAKARVRLKSR